MRAYYLLPVWRFVLLFIFISSLAAAPFARASAPPSASILTSGAPVITTHPRNSTFLTESSGILTVEASGAAPLTYRWSKDGVSLEDGAKFAGTRTAQLKINFIAFADRGSYQVEVRNADGSATSNAAFVEVPGAAPPKAIWAVNVSVSEGGWCNPWDLEKDDSGNSYVTGAFKGVIQVGDKSVTSQGDSAMFLAKFDNGGKPLWILHEGNDSLYYAGRSIVLGVDGTIWVGGAYYSGFYLARFDEHGNKLSSVINGTGASIMDMARNAAGEIYLFGGLGGSGRVGDDPEMMTSVSNSWDAYVAKLSPEGQVLWKRSYGGPGSDSAQKIAMDEQGNAYLAGTFEGTVAFGANSLTSAGSSDIFIAKLRPDGELAWTRRLGSAEGDGVYSLSVSSLGRVLAGGMVTGFASFGSSVLSGPAAGMFAVELDSNGNLVEYQMPSFDGALSSYAIIPAPANGFLLAGFSPAFMAISSPAKIRWTKYMTYMDARAVAYDRIGNILAAGSASSPVEVDGISFSPGVFIAKFGTDAPLPPLIKKPLLAQRTHIGGMVELAGAASGFPAPEYQWRLNETVIPGATNATLVLTNLQLSASGEYSVEARNSGGVAVSRARVDVGAPRITTQPPDQFAFAGQGLILTGRAEGAEPLQYRWTRDGLALSESERFRGTETSELTIVNLRPEDSGLYRFSVWNDLGEAVSSPASVAVAALPVIHPASQVVARGATVTFEAEGLAEKFQWRLNGVPIPDATNRVFTLASAPFGASGDYTVEVTRQFNRAVSLPARLDVGAPRFLKHPEAITIFAGQPVTLAGAADGVEPMVFRWLQRSNYLSDGGRIAGSGTTNLSISSAQPGDAGDYVLEAVNRLGALRSAPARLSVHALPEIQPRQVAVPIGGFALFTVDLPGDGSLRHQWQFNGTNIAGATNLALALSGLRENQSGEYVLSIRGPSGEVKTPPARLEVGVPVVEAAPLTRTVYEGSPVEFSATVSGRLPFAHQWLKGTNRLADNGRISGARNGTLRIAQAGPEDSGSYSAEVTNAIGSAISQTIALKVISVPEGTGPAFAWAARFDGAYRNAVAADDSGVMIATTLQRLKVNPGGQIVWTNWGAGVDVRLAPGGGSYVATTQELQRLDANGAIIWSQRWNQGQGNITIHGISAGPEGEIYAAGAFQGTLTMGGVTLRSTGGSDPFLARYDQNGAHVWLAPISGAGEDAVRGVAADRLGNVYVCGELAAPAIFGETNILAGDISSHLFVAKYDREGVLQWARHAQGAGSQSGANGLAVDAAGGVVAAGWFSGTLAAGRDLLSAQGTRDMFLVRWNASGNPEWGQRFGKTGSTQGNAVALDSAGNIYVTGDFQREAVFGEMELSASGIGSAFVSKHGALGQPLWAVALKGDGFVAGADIDTAPNGEVYFSGSSGAGAAWDEFRLGAGVYVGKLAPSVQAVAPKIVAEPKPQTAPEGASATLWAGATGFPAPAYQWRHNGQPISGATNDFLRIPETTPQSGGSYSVVASNAAGFAESAAAVLTIGPRLTRAQREAASFYYSGIPMTVRLVVEPASNLTVYAVEDAPPAGWAVADISDGGRFDAPTGRVKFGPFFERERRVLTYKATPAENQAGVKEFSGQVIADGMRIPIRGASSTETAMGHPADVSKNFTIDIVELSNYVASWRSRQDIPVSYLTRAVAVWSAGERYTLDPSLHGPPLMWVTDDLPPVNRAFLTNFPLREILAPADYVPGRAFTARVRIGVAAALAYAVECAVPEGWSATPVSHDGRYVAELRKLRWGPFQDGLARDLEFRLQPPLGGAPSVELSGVASFDGYDLPLPARVVIARSQIASAVLRPTGQLELRLSGHAGAQFHIETSADLKTWQSVQILPSANGEAVFIDTAPQSAQKYYRVRVE